MECIETVNLEAFNADVHDHEGAAVSNQKFSRDSYTTVQIVAKLGYIIEISFQLRAMNLDNMARCRSSIEIHGYDYTHGVLTVTIKSGAGPVNLEEILIGGQTRVKNLRAGLEIYFQDGRNRYQAPQQLL